MSKINNKKKVSFLDFSYEKKFKLLLIACLAIIVIWSLLFSYMQKNKKSSIKRNTRSLSHLYLGKKNYLNQLSKQAIQIKKMEEKIQAAREQMLDINKTNDFLEKITQIGYELQLQFIYFKPKALIKEQYYAKLPVEVALVGTFDNIAAFLSELANLNIIVVINNSNIMSRSNTDPRLNMIMELTIYCATAKESKDAPSRLPS